MGEAETVEQVSPTSPANPVVAAVAAATAFVTAVRDDLAAGAVVFPPGADRTGDPYPFVAPDVGSFRQDLFVENVRMQSFTRFGPPADWPMLATKFHPEIAPFIDRALRACTHSVSVLAFALDEQYLPGLLLACQNCEHGSAL